MVWLLFALLANLMYSFSSIIDQFIRKKHIKHDRSMVIIWMAIFLLLWLTIVPFINVSIPPPPQLAAVLASGFIIIYTFLPYFYAISREDVSKVMPLFQFYALFILVSSIIFLGEILSTIRYAGFAVMFSAGMLMTVEKVKGRFTLNKTLLLVMGASAIMAASMILLKFFYLTESFWNGFFWFNIGGFLGTLSFLLIPGTASNLKSDIHQLNLKILALVLLTTIITLFGDMSLLFAIKSGPISLVSVVGSTQIAILFVMTLLLSKYFPKILKEKTDRKTLLTKTFAIGLMIIGLILVSGVV